MRVNTFLFQSFLVDRRSYRVVETCGFDSFWQIIIVSVVDNIVPREVIENALPPNLQELIFMACENLSLTLNFYELRLNILLRYAQNFNPAAITSVRNNEYSFVNCRANVNFVISMLLQGVPVLQERYESCPLGHQTCTRTRANLQVSVQDIRNSDLLRMTIPDAFSEVNNTACSVRIAEGFECPAPRESSVIHAGKYSLHCDFYNQK